MVESTSFPGFSPTRPIERGCGGVAKCRLFFQASVWGGGGGSAQAAYHQTFLRFISEGPKEKPPSFPRDIRRTSWA